MPQVDQKYRRDFKNLDYANPRLMRETAARRWWLIRLVAVLLIVVIMLGIYFFLFSPFFLIREVTIEGLEKIKKENIEKIINEYREQRFLFFLTRNNFWLFNADKLRQAIFQKYYFDSFTIDKRLPNRVLIQLREKQAVINWLTENTCFHLDPSGLVIEYCENNHDYLTIKDKEDQPVRVGERALASEDLKYLVDLFETVKTITLGKLSVNLIERSNGLLDFITSEGPVIKFNENLTIEEQAARLDTLLHQGELNLNKLEYLDLRFGEKVFYK